jgi:hypothetical protein
LAVAVSSSLEAAIDTLVEKIAARENRAVKGEVIPDA